jgi:hypothetical protein
MMMTDFSDRSTVCGWRRFAVSASKRLLFNAVIERKKEFSLPSMTE